MNRSTLHELLKKSEELVSGVASRIAADRIRLDPKDLQQKSDKSLVSFVDQEAEERLIEGLSKLLPTSQFLSEEMHSSTQIQPEGLLWIVDPLDGTTNFIHQLPFYCISVALLENGVPVLGMVYEIPHKNCYWALKGEGSFLNKQQIRVSKTKSIEDSLLAVGFFSEDTSSARLYVEALSRLSLRTRGWRRFGSAALQMAYVAAGYVDAYIDVDLKPWDMAAGILLVQEAGGRLSDLSGAPFSMEKGELLASGKSYDSFLQFMQSILSKK